MSFPSPLPASHHIQMPASSAEQRHAELVARLDRIEDKLDQLLAIVPTDPPTQESPGGP